MGTSTPNGSTLKKTGTIKQNGVSHQVVNVTKGGAIELQKVRVTTDYNVCHDATLSSDEFENFWMLEHAGEYWQWLKTGLRTTLDKDNKPEIIPITLSGNNQLEFTAVFNVLNPLASAPKIKVTNKAGYTFLQQDGSASGEFTLVFQAENTPLDGNIELFEQFDLTFEYSIDGGSTWNPLGLAQFCLYLTWKQTVALGYTVRCSKDKQLYVLESLLWIGCKQAKGRINDDEATVLEKVFENFTSLKVVRCREGKMRPNNTPYFNVDYTTIGLGYWRDNSSLIGRFARTGRDATVLLNYGEARCGEWTDLFLTICTAMGATLIPGRDTLAITSTNLNLGGVSSTSPDHINRESMIFCVKNASIAKINDYNNAYFGSDISGQSRAQGNDNAQPVFQDHIWFCYNKDNRFFDASYGIKFTPANSKIKNYSSTALSGITVLVPIGTSLTTSTPTIVTSDIHRYLKASKNLFI
jgi:hypothetical protein